MPLFGFLSSKKKKEAADNKGQLLTTNLKCLVSLHFMSCVLSFVAMPGLIVGVGFKPAPANEGQPVNNNYSTASRNPTQPSKSTSQTTPYTDDFATKNHSRVQSYPNSGNLPDPEPDRKSAPIQKKPDNSSHPRYKPQQFTASTPNLLVQVYYYCILFIYLILMFYKDEVPTKRTHLKPRPSDDSVINTRNKNKAPPFNCKIIFSK